VACALPVLSLGSVPADPDRADEVLELAESIGDTEREQARRVSLGSLCGRS